jgi:nitroreductase
MHKPAITQVAIDQTIANRWSGRAYDATKPVTHEQVIALLEAARWAPSCYGDQPWRFIVWNKCEDAAGWQQAFDCLVQGNQGWAKDAQVLVLVCADTLFGHNQKPNRFAQYDTGAAVENLCLQATALGLMAHQMGGYDADLAREKFNVPEQYTLMAMLTVGYPADINSLSGETLQRETAQRSRKPLSEVFFTGQWGNSIKT